MNFSYLQKINSAMPIPMVTLSGNRAVILVQSAGIQPRLHVIVALRLTMIRKHIGLTCPISGKASVSQQVQDLLVRRWEAKGLARIHSRIIDMDGYPAAEMVVERPNEARMSSAYR